MNIARSRLLLHVARGVRPLHARALRAVQTPRRLEARLARKRLSTEAGAGQQKHEEDLISRHGGKMVLGVIAAVVGLIYRWIKSKGDATKTEGLIHGTLALEPNEINELRLSNELSSSEYKTLVSQLLSQYPTGSVTYADFITAVKQHLNGRTIANAHLLDRIVLADPMRGFDHLPSDTDTTHYSLDYLLTALNLCIDEPAIFRADALWHMLRRMEEQQQTGLGSVSSDSHFSDFEVVDQHSDSGSSASTSSINSSDSSGAEATAMSAEIEDVTLESIQRMVDLLLRTCQLPGERLVSEEKGNFIPYQKHQKSTADELIVKAKKELKLPSAEHRITADRFHALLVSHSICAWGECYREKKK